MLLAMGASVSNKTSSDFAVQHNVRSVLNAIEGQGAQMIADVLEWSALNSGSHNLPGLEKMAEILEVSFADLGASVEKIQLDPLQEVNDLGEIVTRPQGKVLRFSKRNQAKRKILLCIHYDTVFGADHPFQSPRWLDENTLNGPGVADAKGGILVILNALRAFEASPMAEKLGWEVILNPDEELGSIASAPILAEAAKRNHLGLVYEPALEDGTFAGARAGSGNFSVVVRGRAAHAGRDFAKGRNAVMALARFLAALDQLNGLRDGLTINAAKITGGGALNVVSDFAMCRFNIRMKEAEDGAWALAEIKQLIESVNQQEGISCTLHGDFTRTPKPMHGRTKELFDWVRDIGSDLDLSISWRATGGCCDGNNLAAAGLPTIDTLGVRGGMIHSDQEFVKVDSLVERTKLTALILMKVAQSGLPWQEAEMTECSL